MTRAMGNGVVADAHNDLLMAVHHLGHDRDYFRRVWLPQLHEGGVGLQVLPVYVDEVWIPESALRQTLRLVETALEMIERCSDEVALCLKPGNVEEALRSGRIAIVLALEGCSALGQDVEVLHTLFRLGVRVASLTHFGRNSLADGSAEEGTQSRLTRAGLRAVQLMEQLGILVDVSHLSLLGTQQILEICSRPVMASHSSCHALRPHHRNLPDRELLAIANTGGVVGINFFPSYLTDGQASIEMVVDHIKHAAGVAGIEHIGLGPDFTREVSKLLYAGSHVIEGCDLGDAVPGLSGPGDFPALKEALVARGLSAADIAAVMGGNFVRLMNESIGGAGANPVRPGPEGATASGVV